MLETRKANKCHAKHHPITDDFLISRKTSKVIFEIAGSDDDRCDVDTTAASLESLLLFCLLYSFMSSSSETGVPPQGPVGSSSDGKPAAAGIKRPPPPADDDNSQLSEKKLRRLEKNRLSARECRRRKREATENLEREINVLEGENLRLRLQLQVRCSDQ